MADAKHDLALRTCVRGGDIEVVLEVAQIHVHLAADCKRSEAAGLMLIYELAADPVASRPVEIPISRSVNIDAIVPILVVIRPPADLSVLSYRSVPRSLDKVPRFQIGRAGISEVGAE